MIWLNHHSLFRIATGVTGVLAQPDPSVVRDGDPFTTSTYAEYARRRYGRQAAVLAYGVVTEGMAISFTLILAQLLKAGLTSGKLPADQAENCWCATDRHGRLHPVITLIGWFYPPAMLVFYAGVIGYYPGPVCGL